MEELRLSSELPERFARLYDYRLDKFETPLDDRGIVDIDALCELGLWTYPGSFTDFQDGFWDKHHVYFTEEYWKQFAASQETARDAATVMNFRNSTPQIAYIPRALHEHIEKATIPAPAPSLEGMRRRNASWEIATILFEGADLLDKARSQYENKKHNYRMVPGYIPGITPRSKQSDRLFELRSDREYWLSQLNSRLEGWNKISELTHEVPIEYRLITEPKLVVVRALKKRIKHDAIVPTSALNLLAA